jgi:carbon storage regulator
MLAITRRPGESFKIDDDVTVHISRVEGQQVRVDIDAPDSVNIVRSELLDKEP